MAAKWRSDLARWRKAASMAENGVEPAEKQRMAYQ